jgi:hypothetical protein
MLVQLDAPPVEKVPAAQILYEAAPLLGIKDPAGAREQTVAPPVE